MATYICTCTRFEVAGKHPERELQKDDLNILRMTRNQIFNGVI
jgi:hypothetical protein